MVAVTGAYYTQMVNPSSKLRVVVINSHLYAENNKATEGTSDPGDQYAWLQTVLKAAQNNSEKVIYDTHRLWLDEDRFQKTNWVKTEAKLH
jgi:hypothetical protein